MAEPRWSGDYGGYVEVTLVLSGDVVTMVLVMLLVWWCGGGVWRVGDDVGGDLDTAAGGQKISPEVGGGAGKVREGGDGLCVWLVIK
ncbi:hypothetical protein Tco_0964343 [Tanacetum coccineum]